MPNYITKIKLPKNTNLRVEISIDKKELDEQVRILREANGEDIYNVFEENISDLFNQVPYHNFVSLPLTSDNPI